MSQSYFLLLFIFTICLKIAVDSVLVFCIDISLIRFQTSVLELVKLL